MSGENIREPVIVSGSARSGTSLTVGCLWHCGLQLGSTCGATRWNEKGQFENRELIRSAEKAYLESIGADPAAQHPLPDPADLVPDPGRRERVLDILRKQGVNLSARWGFKDAKALVDWEVWDAAFPGALWVVTRRPAETVARSCLRTKFMRAHSTLEGWLEWYAYHERRAEALEAHAPERVIRVDTDDLARRGRMDQVKRAVETAGLTWDERRVGGFVSPDLWHFGDPDDAPHATDRAH